MRGLKYSIVLLLLALLSGQCFALVDSDSDGVPDSEESELAAKYAPALYFSAGERLFPVAVEYFLQNCDLKQFTTAEQLVKAGPLSPADIGGYSLAGQEYFLDNRLGSTGGEKIIGDYAGKKETLGCTVYARVFRDGTGSTVIQYYFFYAFNPGRLNVHEGDWEMVQLVLSPGGEPGYVSYSQHEGGERATWEQAEKFEGTHPKVYVALGSHANYLRPFEGAIGLASDRVGGAGLALEPRNYKMEMLGSQQWLDFAGYWGEYGGLQGGAIGQRGPLGPAFREDSVPWGQPVMWAAEHMAATEEWFTYNWVAYNFVMLFMLYVLVRIAISVFGILRRKRSEGLGPRLVSLLYIGKPDAKTIGNILCIVSIAVALIALLYPWYQVNAELAGLGAETEGRITLVSIDGLNGVLVNWFMGQGIVQMFGLGIPFSIVIGIGFLLFVLGCVGIRKTSKAGRKYIARGIANAVPVIVLLFVVMQLPGLVESVMPLLPNQMPAEAIAEAEDIFREVGSAPFGGSYTKTIDIAPGFTQSMEIDWGMGLGAWLLLAAAAIAIIAGVLEISARAEFYGSAKS